MTRPSAQHIGVDLMGSDSEPKDLLKAIFDSACSFPENVHLTLFGTPDVIAGQHAPSAQIALFQTEEFISPTESPLQAIRQKKNASICVAMQWLAEGKLHACVSGGNTGAVLAAAKWTLSPLPSIKRPALLTLLPTRQHEMAVLDVGANATCSPKQLLQFALMGAAHQRARGVSSPRIALLNIGTEAKKGTPLLQTAHQLLSTHPSTKDFFIGNVEARDVFQGAVDVLVTDGFTGNIFLKTAEGIAGVLLQQLQISDPSCSESTCKHLQYAEYPGALLCGVDGIVIKCHGSATPSSFIHSAIRAARLHEHKFLEQLRVELKSLFE